MIPWKTKIKIGIVATLLATLCQPILAEDSSDGGEVLGEETRAEKSQLDAEPTKPVSGRAFLESCGLLLSEENHASLDSDRESEFVQNFKKEVGANIIGQEPAVDAISLVLEMIEAMMNDPEKPLGKILFVGPTGVGKTELARAIVRFFGGSPDTNMIRIDGGEMQQGHEISRITGATASYAGYGDKPMLHPDNVAAATIKFEFSDGRVVEFVIILADEIEKAADEFQKLFLGILDNGKVTLGDNTPSYVRKGIIIGTSNKGAKKVEDLIDQKMQLIEAQKKMIEILKQNPDSEETVSGLTAEDLKVDRETLTLTPEQLDVSGRVDLDLRQRILDTYVGAIKDDEKFPPEWVNRWDGIIQFLHLGEEEFLQISDIFLAKVQKRVYRRALKKVGIAVTDEAKKWLVDQGTDFRNGARELAGVIEKHLTRRVARMISNGELSEGDIIEVIVKDGALDFVRIAKDVSRENLLKFADAEYPNMKMLKVVFDEQIDEPVEESKEIAKAIESDLQKTQAAANHLYRKAFDIMPNPPKVEAAASVGNGNATLEARVLYVKIGDHTYRLTANFMRDNTTGQVIDDPANNTIDVKLTSGGIPPAFQHLFTANTIKQFSVDEVMGIISAAQRQSTGN